MSLDSMPALPTHSSISERERERDGEAAHNPKKPKRIMLFQSLRLTNEWHFLIYCIFKETVIFSVFKNLPKPCTPPHHSSSHAKCPKTTQLNWNPPNAATLLEVCRLHLLTAPLKGTHSDWHWGWTLTEHSVLWPARRCCTTASVRLKITLRQLCIFHPNYMNVTDNTACCFIMLTN